ncbi:hypothetical protein BDZ91DRAFT_718259 [Kalaharituber pfeilii]|nr:hypothetical protein BDZ91DRAFT_718259 [Kalaharituber pfeilii]
MNQVSLYLCTWEGMVVFTSHTRPTGLQTFSFLSIALLNMCPYCLAAEFWYLSTAS